MIGKLDAAGVGRESFLSSEENGSDEREDKEFQCYPSLKFHPSSLYPRPSRGSTANMERKKAGIPDNLPTNILIPNKKVPVPTKMMEKCSQERTPWTNFGTAFKRRKEFAECDPFLKRASKKRENGIFILRAALESGWTIKVRRNISMKLQHFAR